MHFIEFKKVGETDKKVALLKEEVKFFEDSRTQVTGNTSFIDCVKIHLRDGRVAYTSESLEEVTKKLNSNQDPMYEAALLAKQNDYGNHIKIQSLRGKSIDASDAALKHIQENGFGGTE